MTPSLRRDVALYFPVVFSTYVLTAALVDRLGGSPMSFVAALLGAAAFGWFVPIVVAPAASILLLLAARLPAWWGLATRRIVLLATAGPLFAGAMALAAWSTSGDMTVVTWPYVMTVVIPALAYAAVISRASR